MRMASIISITFLLCIFLGVVEFPDMAFGIDPYGDGYDDAIGGQGDWGNHPDYLDGYEDGRAEMQRQERQEAEMRRIEAEEERWDREEERRANDYYRKNKTGRIQAPPLRVRRMPAPEKEKPIDLGGGTYRKDVSEGGVVTIEQGVTTIHVSSDPVTKDAYADGFINPTDGSIIMPPDGGGNKDFVFKGKQYFVTPWGGAVDVEGNFYQAR